MTRLLTIRDVCKLLRRSAGWFSQHRAELEAHGFPKPVPVVDRYDERAITAWLDQHISRLTAERSAVKTEMMERFTNWGKPMTGPLKTKHHD